MSTQNAPKNGTLERLAALGLSGADPADLLKAARRARELRARVAREDPSQFCRFVLRDERTNKHVVQAPMHEEWHKLLSAHDRLLMWSHVEGGKTTQIAVGRVLYELGRDPMLRVCVVSNTSDLAKKMTRLIGQYIEKSAELHEVFPDLRPTDDPSLPWKAQALTVRRPGMGGKDPSVQATGVHGNVIGSRIDLLVLDDILDHENTHTPGPREDVYRWIKSTLMSRLTDNARVWIVGNAWHPDDAMHRLEKDGFVAKRFPVILPDGRVTWPAVWPMERIKRARGSDGLGPLEFARQLMCQARDDTSARFKREWIEVCQKLGEDTPFVNDIRQVWAELGIEPEDADTVRDALDTITRLTHADDAFGGGARVITGVDLAVTKSAAADETVLFTILVEANGVRRVLSIRSGRWGGPEIVNEIERCYRDFGGIFVVESNAAQKYIVDFLRDRATNVPVVPFQTGRNKTDPAFGIESLAVELAAGKWRIPGRVATKTGPVRTTHKEVLDWIAELLFYDPREHTGDRVMASWFAREGARRFVDSIETDTKVGVRVF